MVMIMNRIVGDLSFGSRSGCRCGNASVSTRKEAVLFSGCRFVKIGYR